jgi:hypothetical protein
MATVVQLDMGGSCAVQRAPYGSVGSTPTPNRHLHLPGTEDRFCYCDVCCQWQRLPLVGRIGETGALVKKSKFIGVIARPWLRQTRRGARDPRRGFMDFAMLLAILAPLRECGGSLSGESKCSGTSDEVRGYAWVLQMTPRSRWWAATGNSVARWFGYAGRC